MCGLIAGFAYKGVSVSKLSVTERAEAALQKEAEDRSRDIRAKIHAVFCDLDVGDVWNVSVGQLVFWISKKGPKSLTIHSSNAPYIVLVRNHIILRLRERKYKVSVSNKIPRRS